MEYFFVYMLQCKDDSYYIGQTDNIERRLSEHSEGLSEYTKIRRPVELVFLENCQTREAAFELERKIKKWSRKKKQALIEKNWNKISYFAKKKF
ncbi:hypothetical protein A3F66_05840 [candidate division TM6 bacterium RIFCSPHIGHO2_12_FULL_32_22]|nr:MAG: hypothetical protein A3F66_05840 [candidate division TM6 bacterium RIFCSPHIGHO2_12_FULL_32_22]